MLNAKQCITGILLLALLLCYRSMFRLEISKTMLELLLKIIILISSVVMGYRLVSMFRLSFFFLRACVYITNCAVFAFAFINIHLTEMMYQVTRRSVH